jgi:hypothetical protein
MTPLRLLVISIAEVVQVLNILVLTWLGWKFGELMPYPQGGYITFADRPVNWYCIAYACLGFAIGATMASVLFCLSEIRKNTSQSRQGGGALVTPLERVRREPLL